MQHSKSDAPISAHGLERARTLSTRQQKVVELVAQGLKNSEVAEIIGTTESS